MKIKCLIQSNTKIFEQEYDIDPYSLDLCYTRDSYMSMFYKNCVNKNIRLEILASDTQDFINTIGVDRVLSLYDAKFVILHSNCSFTIENIISPSKEELLDKFCVKE